MCAQLVMCQTPRSDGTSDLTQILLQGTLAAWVARISLWRISLRSSQCITQPKSNPDVDMLQRGPGAKQLAQKVAFVRHVRSMYFHLQHNLILNFCIMGLPILNVTDADGWVVSNNEDFGCYDFSRHISQGLRHSSCCMMSLCERFLGQQSALS